MAGLFAVAPLGGCAAFLGLEEPTIASGSDAAADTGAFSDAAPLCGDEQVICETTRVTFMCNASCWTGCRQTGLDQPTAKALCTVWGGKLARFDTTAEVACVNAQFAYSTWIGLQQDPNNATIFGGWSWNGDGAQLAFQNWAVAEPNDGDSVEDKTEQCGYADAAGGWHDYVCADPDVGAYLCRK
jgi:hypothetical protein